jgi:hypothetical protein
MRCDVGDCWHYGDERRLARIFGDFVLFGSLRRFRRTLRRDTVGGGDS